MTADAEFRKIVSVFRKLCLQPAQISRIYPPSRPTKGRFAIVTDAGRDAVDADALLTNGA